MGSSLPVHNVEDSPKMPLESGNCSCNHLSSSDLEDCVEELYTEPEFNLHRASNAGDLEEVKRILDEEPEKINLADEEGYTPLHLACHRDHADIAKLLIARGADYLYRNVDGWEPLHFAARWGAKSCLEMLVELPGVDINAKTIGGRPRSGIFRRPAPNKDKKKTTREKTDNPQRLPSEKNSKWKS